MCVTCEWVEWGKEALLAATRLVLFVVTSRVSELYPKAYRCAISDSALAWYTGVDVRGSRSTDTHSNDRRRECSRCSAPYCVGRCLIVRRGLSMPGLEMQGQKGIGGAAARRRGGNPRSLMRFMVFGNFGISNSDQIW